MSGRLSHDEFLSKLSTLLTTTHTSSHGSIYLTQKPLATSSTSAPTETDTESPPSSQPSQILIRATNGLSKPHRTDKIKKKEKPKIKLSTVVDEADLEGFYARYAEVCKKGMEGLRKRDKKKSKAKAKGKKGKKGG